MSEPTRAPLEAAEIEARRLGEEIRKRMPPGWGFTLLVSSIGHGGFSTWIGTHDRVTTGGDLRAVRPEQGEPDVNEKGEIVCGLHNRPWCPECSEAARRELLALEAQWAADRPAKKPSWHDGERIRRELAGLGLGKRVKRV